MMLMFNLLAAFHMLHNLNHKNAITSAVNHVAISLVHIADAFLVHPLSYASVYL